MKPRTFDEIKSKIDADDETRPVKRWRVNVCGRFTSTYFIDADDSNEAKRRARSMFEAGIAPVRSRSAASFVGAYETEPRTEEKR